MKFTTKEKNFFRPKLTLVEQLSLYEQLLPKFVVNRAMKSPFRKDEHPSFCVYKSKKSDNLYWKDFATGERGDVKDLQDRLCIVVQPKAYRKQIPSFDTLHIHHTERDFTKNDFNVWMKWGISSKTLMYYGVMCVQEIFTNGRPTWRYTDNNPIYAWRVGEYTKYYRPMGTKGNKWKSYGKSIFLQGEDQIPTSSDEPLIITKSMKDCMLLHELGYKAIAPQSEHIFLTKSKYRYYNQNYSALYLLYDNDKTGCEQSEAICKSNKGLIDIKVPKSKGVKDISDYYAKFGREETLNLLHQLIEV